MYEKEVAGELRGLVNRSDEDYFYLGAGTFDVPSENGCFGIEFDSGERFIVIIQQVSE